MLVKGMCANLKVERERGAVLEGGRDAVLEGRHVQRRAGAGGDIEWIQHMGVDTGAVQHCAV
jgi:hypothetical protein